MSEASGLDGLDLTQCVVLVGVVELSVGDETPAHAGEVRRACVDALDAVEADVVGTLTEAEVARALNELEAETVLEGTRDDTSATGKGRPRFELAMDADDVLAEFAADDRLRPVVSRVESSRAPGSSRPERRASSHRRLVRTTDRNGDSAADRSRPTTATATIPVGGFAKGRPRSRRRRRRSAADRRYLEGSGSDVRETANR